MSCVDEKNQLHMKMMKESKRNECCSDVRSSVKTDEKSVFVRQQQDFEPIDRTLNITFYIKLSAHFSSLLML